MKFLTALAAVAGLLFAGVAASAPAATAAPLAASGPAATVDAASGHLAASLGIVAAPTVLHPAAALGCAYVQFITVYDPRIGRSYAVGAQAWCGGSGSWRVVVGCAQTLGGYAYLTVKGPWTHTYWSVRHCPTTYPYANWASYEHSATVYGFAHPAGLLRGGPRRLTVVSGCHSWVSGRTATGYCTTVTAGGWYYELAVCVNKAGAAYAVYSPRSKLPWLNVSVSCTYPYWVSSAQVIHS